VVPNKSGDVASGEREMNFLLHQARSRSLPTRLALEQGLRGGDAAPWYKKLSVGRLMPVLIVILSEPN
jgi:hypothetical protein